MCLHIVTLQPGVWRWLSCSDRKPVLVIRQHICCRKTKQDEAPPTDASPEELARRAHQKERQASAHILVLKTPLLTHEFAATST